jgi:hypothetical protein
MEGIFADRMRSLGHGVRTAAVIALLLLARRAGAGGGFGPDAYEDIRESAPADLHGLVDLYLIHNFNDPVSRENQLRAFDDRDGPVATLSYVRLTLAHRPGRFGFRIDAGIGNTADVYYRDDPAAASHPELARAMSYVEQAFITVILPLGLRIRMDIGRFSTPVGWEDNESPSNWSYSRSFLYTWAEPSLHTGVRLSTALTGAASLALLWVNGWNSVILDGSGMRSFALAASWRPGKRIEVGIVDMAGLEHPPTRLEGPLSFRNLIDAFVTYKATPKLWFALALDYGIDRAAGGVHWWGISGSVRWQARPWLAAVLRGEYFDDPAGFTTGARQRLAEVTTTVEWSGEVERLRWQVRGEYRHDQSTARVFDGAIPATRSSQDTLTLALIAWF